MEIIFVSAIIGLLLYYCWRVVLIGAIGFVVIFCGLGAYFDHEKKQQQQLEIPIQTTIVQQTIPKVDPLKAEYVRDCVSYGLDRNWCERRWDGTDVDDLVASAQHQEKP